MQYVAINCSLSFQGYYCPLGTQSPTQHPCPAGSWSNLTNLLSHNECYECPKGWYCLLASPKPSGICKEGHYCPPGNTIFLLITATSFETSMQQSLI